MTPCITQWKFLVLNVYLIYFLKGLEYLYKNCLVNMTHEDIAAFLYNEEGLNKVKKGEYLGEKWVILSFNS